MSRNLESRKSCLRAANENNRLLLAANADRSCSGLSRRPRRPSPKASGLAIIFADIVGPTHLQRSIGDELVGLSTTFRSDSAAKPWRRTDSHVPQRLPRQLRVIIRGWTALTAALTSPSKCSASSSVSIPEGSRAAPSGWHQHRNVVSGLVGHQASSDMWVPR